MIKETSILKKLEDAGFQSYIVGGRIRNTLLGLEEKPDSPWDTDITTDALPHEVEEVFRDFTVIETGIKHGTVTVLAPEPVEITTFRRDGDYSDMRHPDSVTFSTSIEDDLSRRDFTVNAIAINLHGKIVDPFGGAKDIENSTLRTVGDADSRFNEDPLRIFRGLRFAAVLRGKGICNGCEESRAFTVEPQTEAALFKNKELLLKVSKERLYTEFCKLIEGDFAGDVIRRYCDIIGVVIPPLLPMKGFDQHNPYHKYTLLEHCVRTLESVDGDLAMKLAALFHDVGKPNMFFIGNDGIGHMYGHPVESERIFREIMADLKADRATTDRAAALIKHHDLVFQKDAKLLKRWMNRFSPELLLDILTLKEADNIATGNMSPELRNKYREVRAMIQEILNQEECFSLKNLDISGKDLIAAGMNPGPHIGDTLSKLLELVIDGKVENTHDDLMDAIAKF